jgi:small subunit ribosomal protein S11
MAVIKNKSTKVKKKREVHSGRAYVIATFNNTLVYITDQEGNVLTWATAGGMGFKGSRKSTPYAAQLAATKAANDAIAQHKLKIIDVYINGAGPGRDAAGRAVGSPFKVNSVFDITGIPHNGVRPSKERRV